MLTRILNEFYRSNYPYLPVVDVSNEAQKKLVGFLERFTLDRWVADKGRLEQKLESVPKELIHTHLTTSDLLSKSLGNHKISVFSTEGQIIDTWSEAQLIRSLADFQESNPQKEFQEDVQETKKYSLEKTVESKNNLVSSSDDTRWMGELLLQSFPWPLFACDLNGHTLFFNKLFEEKILKKNILKDSLRVAEKYLIEKVRELLAFAISENIENTVHQSFPASLYTLNTFDENLQSYLSILNIEENLELRGYFFIFQNNSDPGFQAEVKRSLASGLGLDKIIEEIESRIIYQSLIAHGHNISHAAKALKIKRSTLQHKVGRLELFKRFDTGKTGPIKRGAKKSQAQGPNPNKGSAKNKGNVGKTIGKKVKPLPRNSPQKINRNPNKKKRRQK